jgi:hypothetical protein
MTRIAAGFLGGLSGLVLIILASFVPVPGLGFAGTLLAGILAGIFVARNPKFAGKTAGAGALAGLVAGAVLFIAAVIGGVIAFNSPAGQSVFNSAISAAQATVTASPNGNKGVDVKTLTTVAIYAGTCLIGLIYLGLSTGIGAITGAIAGRGTAAPQANPYGQYGEVPPYGAPPQGTPPPNYPQSPYGTQEPPPQNQG